MNIMLNTLNDFLDIAKLIEAFKQDDLPANISIKFDQAYLKLNFGHKPYDPDFIYFEFCEYHKNGIIKYYVHNILSESLWINEYVMNSVYKTTIIDKKDLLDPLKASIKITKSGLKDVNATVVNNITFALETVFGDNHA